MPGHRARKRFGQHFLTDPGVVDAILRSVHATKDDVVVEIGPGRGAITASLAATTCTRSNWTATSPQGCVASTTTTRT